MAEHSRISAAFKEFNDRIKVKKETLDTINYRLNRAKIALDNYYYGSERLGTRLFVGSIGRQTDIHTSDVDVIYKVPDGLYSRYNNYASNGQQRMLQDFRSALLSTYSTTYIKADGLVAVVAFSDNIIFEIMPGIMKSDNSFVYPVSNNGGYWGLTNPLPEIEAMNQIQRETARNAKKLARMVRAWKEYHGVNMGGLLIDTYVYRFLKDYEGKSRSFIYYDWMSRDFFKFLSSQNDQASYIYALGSNQKIYLKGRFAYSATKAYNIAVEAIDAFEKEYYWTAGNKWSSIYGSKFPSV
jgi:hypothetical protein